MGSLTILENFEFCFTVEGKLEGDIDGRKLGEIDGGLDPAGVWKDEDDGAVDTASVGGYGKSILGE